MNPWIKHEWISAGANLCEDKCDRPLNSDLPIFEFCLIKKLDIFNHLPDPGEDFHLCLKDGDFCDSEFPKLSGLTSMVYLDLWCSGWNNPDKFKCIRGNFPWLRGVGLESTSIEDSFLENLPNPANLNDLNLRSTRLTDEGLRLLLRYPALRRLDIRGTSVTTEGIQMLCDAFDQRLQIVHDN